MKRNAELRTLIEKHKLTRFEVCRLLKIKVLPGRYSAGRLDNWLADRNEVPADTLDLLKVRLALRKV